MYRVFTEIRGFHIGLQISPALMDLMLNSAVKLRDFSLDYAAHRGVFSKPSQAARHIPLGRVCFCVKLCHQTGSVVITVQEMFRMSFGCRKGP
jgi:hypothetical protein